MRIITLIITLLVQLHSHAAAPSIVAEFETRVSNGKNKTVQVWQFDRNENQVVHSFADLTKRWTLLGLAEIALEQIYPAEKMVIEFNQGDLKSVGGSTDWASIIHLVDTNLLGKLTAKSARRVHGKSAVLYTGVINDAKWEIVWIPDWQLPASIRREDKGGRMKTELKRLLSTNPAELDRGFMRIDFADVGDMENNEQLQRVLRRSPEMAHAHRH
jgi:hypothetical protein